MQVIGICIGARTTSIQDSDEDFVSSMSLWMGLSREGRLSNALMGTLIITLPASDAQSVRERGTPSGSEHSSQPQILPLILRTITTKEKACLKYGTAGGCMARYAPKIVPSIDR
jgi:hypothetical protein